MDPNNEPTVGDPRVGDPRVKPGARGAGSNDPRMPDERAPGQRPGDEGRAPRGIPGEHGIGGQPGPGVRPFPLRPAARAPGWPGSAAGDRPTARGEVGEEVLHAHAGPGALDMDEDEFRERMDLESPDGRPPPQRDRRAAQWLFVVLLAAAFVAVIGVLWAYAGPAPAAIALFLILCFMAFAAWPTWHAAWDRRQDAERIKREVAEERRPR